MEGTSRATITRLHSDPPFVLRPTNPVGAEPMRHWYRLDAPPVQVSLVSGAAGPVGGDELKLSIDVESGAALVLRNVAATLVLPGPHHQQSRIETVIRVAAGGAFVWLPRPVIAARSCHHLAITRVMLEPGARLLLREELLLGRHGEQPGAIRQRLRVTLGGRPLHDQELALGAGVGSWDGPAVTGGRRAVGSVLIVDPEWDHDPIDLKTTDGTTDTALLPLSESAVLITALAKDGLALHQMLDAGIAAVEASLVGTSA
jgi:urease accessory protein